MKYYRVLLLLWLLMTCCRINAQNFSDADLEKITGINTNIVDAVLKSALGFKDMRGAIRQKNEVTVIYDAVAIAGLHAQQYFITDVVGKTRSVYMAYYTDVNDLPLVAAAVMAMPAFAGNNWALRQEPANEGETNEDILLGGTKVGNLNIRSKEKTAVLSLGFFEDPGTAQTKTPAAEKEAPHVTAKCASGNCQSGKGEMLVYDKQGILTDRLAGEFGGGQFLKGIHFSYGNGLSPAAVEKDEGVFKDFILTDGTVTLSGYGLTDTVFDTKTYTAAGNCITGDCKNGEGRMLTMQPAFGHVQLIIRDGKFREGEFLTGTMFVEGVDTLYDGHYTMEHYKYHTAHNQAWADAEFLPRGSTEKIKGTWHGGSNSATAIPFYLSDGYFKKEGRFIGAMKTKGIPGWILNVYVPVSHVRGEKQRKEAHVRDLETLEYDMKIHPNDYKTNNTYSENNNNCSCCNGTGSVGSGQTFMGREIPKRCSCCSGTGRR